MGQMGQPTLMIVINARSEGKQMAQGRPDELEKLDASLPVVLSILLGSEGKHVTKLFHGIGIYQLKTRLSFIEMLAFT